MQYNFLAKGFTPSDHIRDYVEQKLVGTAGRFSRGEPDENIKLDIEISRTTGHHQKGEVWYAEVNYKSGTIAVRAQANAESPTAAIDMVEDEFSRELRAKKEKNISFVRRGARAFKDMVRGFRRR